MQVGVTKIINTRTGATGLYAGDTDRGNSRDGVARVRVCVPHPSIKGATKTVIWTYWRED
jgi:hypothetical protein